MKKILLYISLLAAIVLGIAIYNVSSRATIGNASQASSWQPTLLSIPRLHIDAPIIFVGQTASGEMEAPISQAVNSPYWTSAFWYAPGVAPGQEGNAVIAGHIDRVGGDPAIFWSLSTLQVGDSIFVMTGEKKKLQFVVERTGTYPATGSSQQVLDEVFGPTKEHRLNLITCVGAWTEQGYDQRLVVFTKQVT